MRAAITTLFVVYAANCSGASTTPAEATASASSESSSAASASSATPTARDDLGVSALVTNVKRWDADGSVADGELGAPEPYVAAVEANLSALRECAITGEIAVSLKLRPSGEIASLDELEPANPCVTRAVRAVKFPEAPTEAAVLIVVSRP